MDAYAAPTLDRSITDQQTGQPRQATRGMVGVATLLNWDELALGGVVDGMPGIFGDGRMSMGALAGWQPRVGERTATSCSASWARSASATSAGTCSACRARRRPGSATSARAWA